MNTTHEISSSAAVALAWIDAANRQDGDALVALSSPEIEIVGPRGSIRGTSVLRDWIARAGLVLENRRTFARRGSVVVDQRGVWRPAGSDETSGEADVASRFVVVGGLIASFERHDDLEDALTAAGLEQADEIL